MKIGIIGAGSIGATLARRLVAAGHQVRLANSRGAQTIQALAQEIGATAVAASEAVQDVDAIVVSIPFGQVPALAGLFARVPPQVPVIDTSNYYPFRDGAIAAVDGGTPESVWVSEQIGRPVIKAFNAVLAYTLAQKGLPSGAPERIAIPVAGDDQAGKAIACELVEAAGFDALDAGDLAGSWRQQPGAPAYCTELRVDELRSALAAADKARAPQVRDQAMQEFAKRGDALTHEVAIALNRTITRLSLRSGA
jgi:predicted dinucleotide-binding enzyme